MQNGAKWSSSFSAWKNAENEHELKHELQVRIWRFLKSWIPEYESLYLSLVKSEYGFQNFNKKEENEENIHSNFIVFLKTKKAFLISMFVLITSGKRAFYIFNNCISILSTALQK